jgi:ribonucleotide monophosphatase NagD (HAD superfamily)
VGRLTGIDTVLLLDLDGTLYVGSQVVPGAPETVRSLRAQGLTVRFTTNTDSIPPTAWPGQASEPPTSWSPVPATEPPTTT